MHIDSEMTYDECKKLLEFFLSMIKNKSKQNKVKLSGFGSFIFKSTPKRIGRNPRTNESYIIPKLNKMSYRASNMIKEKLN